MNAAAILALIGDLYAQASETQRENERLREALVQTTSGNEEDD